MMDLRALSVLAGLLVRKGFREPKANVDAWARQVVLESRDVLEKEGVVVTKGSKVSKAQDRLDRRVVAVAAVIAALKVAKVVVGARAFRVYQAHVVCKEPVFTDHKVCAVVLENKGAKAIVANAAFVVAKASKVFRAAVHAALKAAAIAVRKDVKGAEGAKDFKVSWVVVFKVLLATLVHKGFNLVYLVPKVLSDIVDVQVRQVATVETDVVVVKAVLDHKAILDHREWMARKGSKVYRALGRRATPVHKAWMGHRDSRVILGHKATLVHKVCRALMVRKGFKAILVLKA